MQEWNQYKMRKMIITIYLPHMSKDILSDPLVLSRVSHRAARLKLCLHWETFVFSEPGLSTRGDALSSMAITRGWWTTLDSQIGKLKAGLTFLMKIPIVYKSPHLILLMSQLWGIYLGGPGIHLSLTHTSLFFMVLVLLCHPQLP